MMGGFGMFMMMAWMPLVILFWLIVIAVVIWLVIRWLNQKKTPTMPYPPPREGSFQSYEQGYQSPPPAPETYREGGKQYQSPQPEYEEPQAHYPQQQEIPPSR